MSMTTKLIVLIITLLLTAVAASATPVMELVPDSTTIFRDSLFAVDLQVDATSTNLKAYSVEIVFNRAVVRTDSISVTEGGLLASMSQPTFFWTAFAPDSATLYIDGAILGDGITVSGGGELAQIVFYTIGFGESDLQVQSIRARDGLNQPLSYLAGNAWVKVCQFVGDVNADNRINISDCVYLINWIFANGPTPIPDPLVGDVECNGYTNISDVVYLISYIFSGGPAPCDDCY